MSIVQHNARYWGEPIAKQAAKLGVDPAWMHAVAAVEVGQISYPGLGAPVVRFEVHRYIRAVPNSQVVQLRVAPTAWHSDAHWYKDDSDADWERVHSGSQSDEWGALIRCMEENPTAAWANASYGVGQLMGWHAGLLGYPDSRTMVGRATGGGVSKQIVQWGRYIERDRDGEMLLALKTGDIESFVRMYNGTGQIPYYTNALQKRYEEALEVLAGPLPTDEDIELDTATQRQQALTDLGYGSWLDPWGVDGDWGGASVKALKAFQGDHGLNPDGWWGRYTEEHVERALVELAGR